MSALMVLVLLTVCFVLGVEMIFQYLSEGSESLLSSAIFMIVAVFIAVIVVIGYSDVLSLVGLS